MLESDDNSGSTPTAAAAPVPRKRTPRKASAPAGTPAETSIEPDTGSAAAPRKRAPRKAAAAVSQAAETTAPASKAVSAPKAPAKRVRKAAAKAAPGPDEFGSDAVPSGTPLADSAPAEAVTADVAPAKKSTRKRVAKKSAGAAASEDARSAAPADAQTEASTDSAPALAAPGVLFMAPSADEVPPKRRRVAKKAAGAPAQAPAGPASEGEQGEPQAPARRTRAAKKTAIGETPEQAAPVEPTPAGPDVTAAEDVEDETADPEDIREAAIEQASGARRRRRRGRRGRGGSGSDAESPDEPQAVGDEASGAEATDAESSDAESSDADGGAADSGEPGDASESAGSRRRRRRRRSAGGDDDSGQDDPPNTVTHVREPKKAGKSNKANRASNDDRDDGDDGVRGVKGSTRLEAKRQRRRDGRETTRRRAPILTEAEFLARREAVDRVMAVRQRGERTQIAVLEDGTLVEHYVTRASATSYVGNVYLGRVQNVLPSMEAAFIDIGKGRNGVLYAGEVNWDVAGLEGKSRAIEQALKSGDPVLVQVTKDPIGHKGARLTSQVSLPGRFLVYVPGGGMTGISRRLPDIERHRLKSILKKIVPEDAGVIVRTAAEGASEEDLTHDVERLRAQWESIQHKAGQKKSAPTLVHGEPDLAIRVVRDVFNEDFKSLVVEGDEAWNTVSDYVRDVAPDLGERVAKHVGNADLFHQLRVDEQLMKALDRKVWLPSGGSLVIDRTEAMTVIDVNTGKFVGSGGNLEQTVTRNNLEAAEEIVRQLRLRDVGGIVVIDFIDMVLESNRELVLRRLTECLGRDRTKHQVAEVTSLGLVQMTRKRVGEGLLEAFSEPCEYCQGRGVIVHTEPVAQAQGEPDGEDDRPKGKRRRGGARASEPAADVAIEPPATEEQRQAANAAIAAIHRATAAEKAAAQGDSVVDELATGLVRAAMKVDSEGTIEPVAAAELAPEAASEAAQPAEASQAADQLATGDRTTADPTRAAVISTAVVEVGSSAEQADPAGNGRAGSPDTLTNEAAEAHPNGAPQAHLNGAPAPGRRRRRAASRPAGPPVPTS